MATNDNRGKSSGQNGGNYSQGSGRKPGTNNPVIRHDGMGSGNYSGKAVKNPVPGRGKDR